MSKAACEQYCELASGYADERLEGAELLRLERHLEECAACREFEAGIRRLRELLRVADSLRPALRPPPGFAAGVMARAVRVPAPAAPAPAPRTAASLWGAMALAAAAAAVFFLWSWQRIVPGSRPGTAVVAQGPAAQAEEASMEGYFYRHAALARERTLLGPAEEIDFAAFRAAQAAGR